MQITAMTIDLRNALCSVISCNHRVSGLVRLLPTHMCVVFASKCCGIGSCKHCHQRYHRFRNDRLHPCGRYCDADLKLLFAQFKYQQRTSVWMTATRCIELVVKLWSRLWNVAGAHAHSRSSSRLNDLLNGASEWMKIINEWKLINSSCVNQINKKWSA